VQLDQRAGDRHAKSEAAALGPMQRCVLLPETLEQVRKELWRDAAARIADRRLDLRVARAHRSPHGATWRLECHDVLHDVPEHLLEPGRVSSNQQRFARQVAFELDGPGMRRGDDASRTLLKIGLASVQQIPGAACRSRVHVVEDVIASAARGRRGRGTGPSPSTRLPLFRGP